VPLNDQHCRPLAHVTRAFAAQVQLQGTGKLRDGRLVNVATRCQCGRPCFHIVAASKEWGTGGSGKPLSPFRSVAVDPAIVPLGTTLYIPALDGVRMPGPRGVGGFIHDGCVIAVDTGGGIDGHQLDLFVGRRAYYKALARKGGSHGWAKSVEVWRGRGRCEYMGAGKVRRAAAGGT
jgi:3D (Asp-Asp-Asp) domain-containing protein